MTFQSGEEVLIVTLQKRGRVIEELKPGVFRVMLGSMGITCNQSELRTVKQSANTNSTSAITTPEINPRDAGKLNSIDLHGLRVNDALNEIEQHLDRACLANIDKFTVIHGIGEGKIKSALEKFFRGQTVVKNFKQDESNPGAMIVYL